MDGTVFMFSWRCQVGLRLIHYPILSEFIPHHHFNMIRAGLSIISFFFLRRGFWNTTIQSASGVRDLESLRLALA